MPSKIEEEGKFYAILMICGEKSDLFLNLEKDKIELYPVGTFMELFKDYSIWLLERKQNVDIKLEKKTPYFDDRYNKKALPLILIKEERKKPREITSIYCLPFYEIKNDEIGNKGNGSKLSHDVKIYEEVKREDHKGDFCFIVLKKSNDVKMINDEIAKKKYKTPKFVTSTNNNLNNTCIVREDNLFVLKEGKYLLLRIYYEIS